MHAMVPVPAAALALALLAGCSSPQDVERATGVDRAGATASASASANGGAAAPEAMDFAEEVERDGGTRTFEYSWPAAVSAQPELAQMLTARRDTSLAEEKAAWERDLKAAPADCEPCRNRSLSVEWETVADLPDWLSLSARIMTYTGGAHPNHGLDSLVWDKRANRALSPLDLFRSPVALEQAVAGRYCKALDRERARRLGEAVSPDSVFAACPGIAELTVLLGSSNGKTFDRLGLLAAPYVAGSYAEGTYEIDLTVDTQVLDAVKPEYSASFSLPS